MYASSFVSIQQPVVFLYQRVRVGVFLSSTTFKFEYGIPGFEQIHEFAITDIEGELPMKLMEAVGDEGISFLIASPFFFYPDYEWDLPKSVLEELSINDESDVEIWSIITIPDDALKSTINLMAPLVFNPKKKIGKQHILHDSEFSSRAPLYRA